MQVLPSARVCPNCGAPISIPPDAHEVTCAYCNAVLAIDQRERQAREAGQKVIKLVMIFVAAIFLITFVSTVGGMAMSCWMSHQITSSVGETQRRAMREACRARCPGECRMRDPKSKDLNACIDTCQARCEKD